jgi:AcrR family transcriptional regulator
MAAHPPLKLATDKRALLFAAASDEFAANGFTQASLNRIIARVSMSKSSFYHYFANKADLFHQTLEYALKPVLDLHHAINLEALTAETLWPELMQMVERMTALVDKSPEMLVAGRMFYRCFETPQDRQLTEEILGEFTAWITRLIARGQELEVFRTDIPSTLLLDLVMAVGMSLDRWMISNWERLDTPERLALGQTGFELIMKMLSPTAGLSGAPSAAETAPATPD